MSSGKLLQLSQKQIKQIIQQYQDGWSARSLAEKYGLKCHKNIIKILKKHKVDIRTPRQARILAQTITFSSEEINNLQMMNNDPTVSLSNLARSIKHDPKTLKKVINYDPNKYDRYLINKFDNIKHEEQAYWLGFLTADGSLTDKQLSLQLAVKDLLHLIKFKEFIGVDYKISLVQTILNDVVHDTCRYCISSMAFVQSLHKHHLFPKKSAMVSIPETIPTHLLKDYVRGLIDGDGTFGRYNNKLRFSLISSIKMCQQVQQFLMERCQLKQTKINVIDCQNGDQMAILTYCGNKQVMRIADFLYKDAAVYLNRKYQVIKQKHNE